MSESILKAFTTLIDKEVDDPQKKVDIEVECGNNSIYITPKGYGDACSRDGDGCPVMLEIWNGELRVVIWGDINEQDPTHIISLENAREALRKNEDGTIKMSLNELDKLRRDRLDVIWEEYDLGLDPDTQEYAGDDGWETIQPGNEYWRNFYYYNNPEGNGPSTRAVFTVQFKPNSTEIDSAEPTWD